MERNLIFQQLKSILKNFEAEFSVLHDTDDNYYLNLLQNKLKKKPEFFGSVQIKKSYISYHLMPLYYHAELLDFISEDLKKRLHGKTCFNFKKEDEELFGELILLTKKCVEKYKFSGKM